jgi:hypothetical protein
MLRDLRISAEVTSRNLYLGGGFNEQSSQVQRCSMHRSFIGERQC